ncbi:ABC transporter ATP-binding protein [Aliiglaciecola sp. LCG003]|uniref:ABC transporter ATP-binding protein n=1 Tax=Aliiglaciecola sp. LCG003 TaxID=3053655 RepID=UPI00257439F2|nr:ABC transporter ATP-binding protein [Aliiglaciecola sp. LCG003]WJG08744.1 ABC transporter ATP-binding protein [Aliiglaciecola sp. LCG003]
MLAVQSLSKSYQQKRVLSDISFTIEPGEIVALLGANGSGKTTTIQSICGLIEFDSGQIEFDGISIGKDPKYLAHIGAVLGGSRNTNWRLTASQNAQYFAALRGFGGNKITQTIATLEQRLGLQQYHHQEVLKLSTGNKQKAALLCALAYSPKLLLLDEPTLGLDFETVSELQNIIRQQSKDLQQGFLITSHDLAFIDKICQKVLVINDGKLAFNGSIEQLKKTLYSYSMCIKVEQAELQNVFHAAQEKCHGHFKHYQQQDSVIIEYEHSEQVMPLLAWLHNCKIMLLDLTMTPISIEDAYHSLNIDSAAREARLGEVAA